MTLRMWTRPSSGKDRDCGREHLAIATKAKTCCLSSDRRAVIEAVTLYWSSPLSFMLFMAASGSLVALGIIIYLVAIVVDDRRNTT